MTAVQCSADPRLALIPLDLTITDDDCWRHPAPYSNGYGYLDGQFAHRTTYELFVGPIPAGLEIDHLCHTNDLTCTGGTGCLHRRCMNPEHLEPVTRAENLRRAASRITSCPHGHEYTPENTIHNLGGRQCRTCKRAGDTRRARRMGIPPKRPDFATHCARGHEYTSENLHVEVRPDGTTSRRCKVCWRINAAARRARRRAA